MKIALASPSFPVDLEDGLEQVRKNIMEASKEECKIICFPEAYLPGMRGVGYKVMNYSTEELLKARSDVMEMAKENHIAVLLPMEWYGDKGLLNLVFVISSDGILLGNQTKNQLDPSEVNLYVKGATRSVFEIDNVVIGIVICHEGWRYPETVRWAAMQGAQIVFHPHCCGNDTQGNVLKQWGNGGNPFYEKAMVCRSLENNIFFASVNYGMKYQDSATAFVSPQGECVAWQPYGKTGILVADIDTIQATGLLAKRFNKDIYNT